ncbi:MAG: hypothetical protein AAB455_00425 [Patescibacteria group bacterium]
MFQDFLLKQMLKRQGLPEAQIDMVLGLIKRKPELFKQIAAEIEEKIKGGMDKQAAAVAVMQTHQAELQGLLTNGN